LFGGLLLLSGLFALPATVAAAGTCQLTTATTPGHVIAVTGSGFAPSGTVTITQTWSGSNATAGGNTGPQTTTKTVTADASGGFDFTIDAGPGHGGTYDIEATDGSCTVKTQAVAVETAGGTTTGGTNGGSDTPPATDTVDLQGGTAPASPVMPVIVLVAGVVLLGLAAILRRDQTRTSAPTAPRDI
jgi:hypothetical protein